MKGIFSIELSMVVLTFQPTIFLFRVYTFNLNHLSKPTKTAFPLKAGLVIRRVGFRGYQTLVMIMYSSTATFVFTQFPISISHGFSYSRLCVSVCTES